MFLFIITNFCFSLWNFFFCRHVLTTDLVDFTIFKWLYIYSECTIPGFYSEDRLVVFPVVILICRLVLWGAFHGILPSCHPYSISQLLFFSSFIWNKINHHVLLFSVNRDLVVSWYLYCIFYIIIRSLQVIYSTPLCIQHINQ